MLTLSQPTGGPLLLDDTQPEESKSLLEEKLKKVTIERAPVAGQQNARGGAGGRGGRSLLDGLVDPSRGSTGNPVMDQLLRSQGRSPFNLMDSQTGHETSGAAAAAGVLTAVDEDGEGDEEASKPDDFDYFTDSSDIE